jgi:hypothetical protein
MVSYLGDQTPWRDGWVRNRPLPRRANRRTVLQQAVEGADVEDGRTAEIEAISKLLVATHVARRKHRGSPLISPHAFQRDVANSLGHGIE